MWLWFEEAPHCFLQYRANWRPIGRAVGFALLYSHVTVLKHSRVPLNLTQMWGFRVCQPRPYCLFFLSFFFFLSPPSQNWGKDVRLSSFPWRFHSWPNADMAVSGYYLERTRWAVKSWCTGLPCQHQLWQCPVAREQFPIKSSAITFSPLIRNAIIRWWLLSIENVLLFAWIL